MSVASDIRLTPAWFLDLLREFWAGDIPLDVCTEEDNPTQAIRYYTEADNAHVLGWRVGRRRGAFCNPPYSRGELPKWIDRVIEQARGGAEVITLTPTDTRTGWYRKLRGNADMIAQAERSVRFGTLESDEKGGKAVEVSRGMTSAYFGQRRARFDRIFTLHGERRERQGFGWVIPGPGLAEVAA